MFVEGSLLGLLRLSYLFALCLLFRLVSAAIFLCLDADMFCSFFFFLYLFSFGLTLFVHNIYFGLKSFHNQSCFGEIYEDNVI